MSRRKIVAGNWKMNKTMQEAGELVVSVLSTCPENNDIKKIFFPPFPYLAHVAFAIESRHDFFCGAQNCHTHDSGAFTGEVSAQAIESSGGSFVLVGHSERRQYFKEDSEMLKAKIDSCFRNHLIPVYCVGEVVSERKSNQHFNVVAKQLEEVIYHLNTEQVSKLILAYEPVWAIGTGETATPAQAEEMHAFIRKELENKFGSIISNGISILYGGSCNPGNAKELFSCPNVDGGLIGGASLKAADFVSIINSF